MKEPQCYKIIKEKPEGIDLGKGIKYPTLDLGGIFLLPKEAGDMLVAQGYAEVTKPDAEKIRKALNNE